MSEIIGTKISENAIVLDAHLINTFRSCEQKFYFVDQQHIFPKRKKVHLHLELLCTRELPLTEMPRC